MQIRLANNNDIEQLQKLYRDTITTINSKDYNPEQIAAWAGASKNVDSLLRRIKEQYFIVAEMDNTIVGFSSLTSKGYLDFMFVHKDYQRLGIAGKLLEAIKTQAIKWNLAEITTDASITARPFFEKNRFKTILQQSVYIIDVMLINYKMQYDLNNPNAIVAIN